MSKKIIEFPLSKARSSENQLQEKKTHPRQKTWDDFLENPQAQINIEKSPNPENPIFIIKIPRNAIITVFPGLEFSQFELSLSPTTDQLDGHLPLTQKDLENGITKAFLQLDTPANETSISTICKTVCRNIEILLASPKPSTKLVGPWKIKFTITEEMAKNLQNNQSQNESIKITFENNQHFISLKATTLAELQSLCLTIN